MIAAADITGCVLCGGQARRMNGLNKGLQLHHGVALVTHALQRLSPQVGTVMVNANRHLSAYRALGVPVWPDAWPGSAGPLAGVLSALMRCQTAYLMVVPCDAPLFPLDLVARLSEALQSSVGVEMAIPVTQQGPQRQPHPVFSLMRAGVRSDLQRYVQAHQRKVARWCALKGCVEVMFEDASAFTNINTLAHLGAEGSIHTELEYVRSANLNS